MQLVCTITNFFSGCIKEVVINNKLSDFLQAARVRHKVSPGCSLYQDQDDEQKSDPCHDHKCQHAGQCLGKNKSRINSTSIIPIMNYFSLSSQEILWYIRMQMRGTIYWEIL